MDTMGQDRPFTDSQIAVSKELCLLLQSACDRLDEKLFEEEQKRRLALFVFSSDHRPGDEPPREDDVKGPLCCVLLDCIGLNWIQSLCLFLVSLPTPLLSGAGGERGQGPQLPARDGALHGGAGGADVAQGEGAGVAAAGAVRALAGPAAGCALPAGLQRRRVRRPLLTRSFLACHQGGTSCSALIALHWIGLGLDWICFVIVSDLCCCLWWCCCWQLLNDKLFERIAAFDPRAKTVSLYSSYLSLFVSDFAFAFCLFRLWHCQCAAGGL